MPDTDIINSPPSTSPTPNAISPEQTPTTQSPSPAPPKLAPFSPLGGAPSPTQDVNFSPIVHNPVTSTSYSNLIPNNQNPAATSQLPVTPNIYPDSQVTETSSKGVIIGFVLFTLFLVFASLILGGAYAIAYGYIDINKPEISKPIEHLVQGIPFMPKTPRFVIEKSIQAHTKVTLFSSELSAEIKSPSLTEVLKKDTLLLKLTGKYDYTDPKNIKFTSKLNLADELDLDALSNDSKLHLRINRLPGDMISAIGLTPSQASVFLSKWFYFDFKELEKQAASGVKADSTNSNEFTEEDTKKLIKVFSQEYISKEIKVTEETINSSKHIKLSFNPSREVLTRILSDLEAEYPSKDSTFNPSEITKDITNFKIEALIQKDKYYLHEASVSIDASFLPSSDYPNTTGPTNQKVTISQKYTLKMSDIGTPFLVDAPSSSILAEQFFNEAMSQLTPPSSPITPR